MESEVVISTTAKRCRCCMTPGITFKDLSLEYEWMGEKEVYVDMLLESFDIKLERRESAGWTICDPCIVRLRDSSNFKKQVLYSERCLLEGLYSDEKNLHIESSKMKRESLSDGDEVEDFETHYLDEDLDLDEDIKEIKREPLASTSEMSNDEDVPLSNLRPPTQTKAAAKKIVVSKLKSKQIGAIARPIKIAMRKDKLVVKKLVERPKMSISTKQPSKPTIKMDVTGVKRTLKINTKPTSNAAAKKGKPALPRKLHFSAAVMNHSTAIPFSIQRRQFKVICIFKCFLDLPHINPLNLLKKHMVDFHKNHKAKALTGKPQSTVRVDITDLACQICGSKIADLELFQSHLAQEHGIKTFKDTSDVLMPFKLESKNVCQVCDKSLENLKKLDEHLEEHFQVAVCEVCGKGFSSLDKMKLHIKTIHEEMPFTCEICRAKFPNKNTMDRHVNYTHRGIGANICWECPGLRFKDYHQKLKHMAEAHDIPLKKIPCETCGAVFSTQGQLTRHVRKLHMEPQFRCVQCKKAFDTETKARQHENMHRGLRLPCPYCVDTYTSKTHLKRHVKKCHEEKGAMTFCGLCGSPFENRLLLAQHVKREHQSASAPSQFS